MKQPSTMNLLLDQTRDLIVNFYSHKLPHVFQQLHPDIQWIGAADGQYLQGYTPVCSYLEAIAGNSPVCDLSNIDINLIYYDGALCILTGQCESRTQPGSGELLAACQRFTVIWKLTELKWRVFHMHISNPLEIQERGEYFPRRAGRLTYEYVRHILKERGSLERTYQFHGKHAETYFLKTKDICYIEADNINCTIHTPKEVLNVCQSISSLAPILSTPFLRIHRSFIVNRDYISQIQRYFVRLTDGTIIPIPEKRYREVCDLLKNSKRP